MFLRVFRKNRKKRRQTRRLVHVTFGRGNHGTTDVELAGFI